LLAVDRRRLHSKPVPVKTWDVYVDDFIGLVQGGRSHHLHGKRVLISSLDEVLHCLDDNTYRQEPVWVKKMLKGDATWANRKIVFGWMLATCAMTIQLPAHHAIHPFEFLDSIIPKQRRATVNKWQKLLGELRFVVLAISGGMGWHATVHRVLLHWYHKFTLVTPLASFYRGNHRTLVKANDVTEVL
jgi:hypothetical protein